MSMLVLLATNFKSNATVKVDSSTTTSVATKSNMDSVMYADGKEVLKGIKTVGGNALGNGYDIVVRQQLVYSWEYLMVGILCLIFAWAGFTFYKQIEKEKPNRIIPAIIFLIGVVWTAIVFSAHFHQVIQGFLNPDYAAINDIIRMFKQGSGR